MIRQAHQPLWAGELGRRLPVFLIPMKKHISSILFFFFLSARLFAQDDLLTMMDTDSNAVVYTSATFKSTRIINSHSVENMAKKHLDFRISHRFGKLNSGSYELWGLDVATIRLGLDYGITDNLMIGVGRSSNQKTYDGYLKLKLLRQSSGARTMPVSVVLLGTTTASSIKFSPEEEMTFKSRLSYCGQLLIARKFNERLSLQLMPTFLHRNRTNVIGEENNVWALGMGGRYKISKRVSINAEYYAVLPDQLDARYHNSLSMGFDIETGGHVFSLHFTNSLGMIEKQFITETDGRWSKGDIHYGFNISRTFSFDHKTKKK
jgi:hypothetical protein